MLLALVSSAFALAVPVRATCTEWLSPGEAPTAGAATTATIEVSNPTTGDAGDAPAYRLTVGSGATPGTVTVQASVSHIVPAFKKMRMVAGANGGPSTF